MAAIRSPDGHVIGLFEPAPEVMEALSGGGEAAGGTNNMGAGQAQGRAQAPGPPTPTASG